VIPFVLVGPVRSYLGEPERRIPVTRLRFDRLAAAAGDEPRSTFRPAPAIRDLSPAAAAGDPAGGALSAHRDRD